MPTPAYSPHALTTVAQVESELGLTSDSGGPVDAFICSLINRLSDRIASYCNRTFEYAAGIVEDVPGYGGTNLVLARTPVLSVASVTHNGQAIDSSTYSIGSAGAGLIYRQYGWQWTAQRIYSITGDPLPGTEAKWYEVTYTGGWVTQPQLDAGTLVSPLVRTLPYDLEDACIQLAATRYLNRGQNTRVKSESLMSASVSYWDIEMSPSITAILDNYRLEPTP